MVTPLFDRWPEAPGDQLRTGGSSAGSQARLLKIGGERLDILYGGSVLYPAPHPDRWDPWLVSVLFAALAIGAILVELVRS